MLNSLSPLLAEAVTGPATSGVKDVFALSIVGLLVVFVSLAMIAAFIAALPKILAVLDPWLPALHGESHVASPPGPAEAVPAREEQIVAAIGFVLLQEMQKAKKSQ